MHTHVRAHTLRCPHSLNLKLQRQINKWINFLCEGGQRSDDFVFILIWCHQRWYFLYSRFKIQVLYCPTQGNFSVALWLNVHTGDTFSISGFIVASLHMADGSLIPQLLYRARVPHPGQPVHALFTFMLTWCIARPLLCLNTLHRKRLRNKWLWNAADVLVMWVNTRALNYSESVGLRLG